MSRRQAVLWMVMVWGLTACANLMPLTVSRDPLSAQEHTTLGDAYLSHREKDLALRQYQAALRQDGKYVPALLALGNLSFGDQDWKKAAHYFKRALKGAPNDPGASNNLAMTYLASGFHLKEAQRLIEKALPDSGPLKPYLLDTEANVAIREGRYADARQELGEAKEEAPANNADFQKNLQESMGKLASATATSGGR